MFIDTRRNVAPSVRDQEGNVDREGKNGKIHMALLAEGEARSYDGL